MRKRRESAHPLDFSSKTTIGRFELIREIARGGMGQVFLGRDTKLGRKVAIKFLLRDDTQLVQRFLVEARATARCTHENIVTIFEVGEHERLPYMVLEYLEGKTLTEVMETKPSMRQFCELMVPVARALERAHEHGIVHRDLKPSNIFVTVRGQVKVLDFGVARLMGRAENHIKRATAGGDVTHVDDEPAGASLTETNDDVRDKEHVLVGTLPYMSPEQWGAGEVDHQSDIWAVGVMFWRALAATHPAGTMVPEKLRARVCDLDTPLPSIGPRVPSLPKELVAIVDRCLAKHKLYRYQNATELLADLQAFLVPRPERTGRTTSEVCPYRGLSAFGEDDAKYFFGRDNEIRTALGSLDVWPLLAVIGPSGVGKSSFVHAGLIPALRSRGGEWQVHVLRPGRLPLQRLALVLEEGPGQAEHLLKQLVEAPGLFGVMLRDAAVRRGTNILVVVDQLEELFTLAEGDDVRRLFLAALLAAADDPLSPVRVVLSMRADFLDRLAGHKHFLAELSRGMFFLTAPDQDNLRETLERPAELAGYSFESSSVVEDIMQTATSRGALPLLSFAATRLWEARDRQRKLLTVAAYQQMGGIAGAFARHADQVAAAVPPQHHLLLRAIMTRLVTPEGTRAVVDHGELLSLATDQKAVELVLDHLVRGRLIQMQTDPDQGATVEIVHEMLISEWPTLKRWLEDGNAMRAFKHELRQAAKQWQTRGKPGDLVWRGAIAQEALANVRRQVLDLSASEQEFVTAIIRRRLRGMLAILAAVVLLVGGVGFAFIKITQANGQARANLDTAEKALGREKAAKLELEEQLHKLEAAQRARESAEKKSETIQTQLTETQQLSRQELEAANQLLQKQVREAQDAKRKAEAEEAKARRANEEALAAKAQTEKLLDEKRREVEQLKKRKKDIIDVDLTGGTK
ncbi:MAG TPA: protein kinase [Kofleriaceae bacterium]|nr:protein kinase [Kofleriaceae bacterium]